ncbi:MULTISPECIES: DUF2141 domain-containing protein [Acetobacteraceae]|uniref:DUF2141 domain-containing protein n=1 Tax=Acetobacteraceae TaxID=433 RepID=UPI00209FF83F|nr:MULTISPECIES: DUF2141 domain-containing protein [Acetobacteraceae]MCP1239650.1 DUF2141 domain-containing protein [Acetobacter lovaniensis]MCQ9156716.1 DUF2141 domain-containing protein [Acidomonas methanolica]
MNLQAAINRNALRSLSLALAAGLALSPAMAQAGDMTVTVTNIPDSVGLVRIGICTEAEFPGTQCALHALVPAARGEVTAIIANVPAGTYAVAAFEDRNGNGKLDRSFFGIPTEPIGFARNPPMRMGPPSFADAALRIPAEGGTVTVALRLR